MRAAGAVATVAAGQVRLANVRERTLVTARARLLTVLLLFFAGTGLFLLRIGQLGLFEPAPRARSMADALLPPRGEITDRNGVPLARAFPAYALWFNPKAFGEGQSPLVRSPEDVARALVGIFPDLDYAETRERLAAGRAGYLRRRVLPEEAQRVHQLGEPALEYPRENERYYPQGSLAAHVLGYVAEGKGHIGMEEVLDKRLADPALRAEPVALSIDMRVQGALEDELSRAMLEQEAKGAAGLVLDVDSGEVLALSSLPAFDPNRADKALNALVFNKVTNQVYELGSTFKPIAVAAAIDHGTVTDLGRRYPAHPLRIGGFTIRDSHPLGASLNVPETLIHSSNIVTAQIADELGGPAMRKTMIDLGMKERPYIELPARGMPLFPRDPKWARITTMTVSYGHGIAVTPLHLASAYASLVNGGIWRPATLQRVPPGQAVKGRRVFKASTSARMRQLLRMIVVDGTGKKADAPGFRVGGKTGSAEKPGDGGYHRSSLVSTFAAAFPMDKPRYVVIVMLDEPKGTAASSYQRTAGWVAAPPVGRLVPRIGPLLGVPPDDSRDVDISDLSPLVPGGGH